MPQIMSDDEKSPSNEKEADSRVPPLEAPDDLKIPPDKLEGEEPTLQNIKLCIVKSAHLRKPEPFFFSTEKLQSINFCLSECKYYTLFEQYLWHRCRTEAHPRIVLPRGRLFDIYTVEQPAIVKKRNLPNA